MSADPVGFVTELAARVDAAPVVEAADLAARLHQVGLWSLALPFASCLISMHRLGIGSLVWDAGTWCGVSIWYAQELRVWIGRTRRAVWAQEVSVRSEEVCRS